jgi:hypothetical protein
VSPKQPDKTSQGAKPSKIITTVRQARELAAPRPAIEDAPSVKKNYAQRFSEALAICVANRLRKHFQGILPTSEGKGQESRARTAKGFKKLDVNYSTPKLGLALGVSIKSVTHPDWSATKNRAGRFTKNYTRIDAELRAEATDYHQRQPYAILVGVLFLPASSCDDANKPGKKAERGKSSFGRAVQIFRPRAGRMTPRNDVDLFERFFVAVYDEVSAETCFFDVKDKPPPRQRRPRPEECLGFDDFINEIIKTYDERNNPPFEWAK